MCSEVQAMQHQVSEALECLSCIPQSKWHSQELKQAKKGGDSSVGYVTTGSTGI